jgi:hypothetical protein
MSGEYITNIIAAVFQYDRINSSSFKPIDHLYTGDDSILKFKDEIQFNDFKNELLSRGSPTKSDKEDVSKGFICYNRRI